MSVQPASGALVVSGTDTGVGKTVVVAGIAAAAMAGGHRVAVLKPAESGIAPDSGVESDIEVVVRLAAPAVARTLATYPDALAPLAAAEECGAVPLAIGDVIEAVRVSASIYDVVLVEGAGGLLVPMGEGGWTVAQLAVALRCPVVVVCRADLGTLNHTALTLEALDHRGVPASVVVGSWPVEPELVHWRNLTDLPGDLDGVVPAGAGDLVPSRFRSRAPAWFTPRLYGRADPERLRLDGVPGPPPRWPEDTFPPPWPGES
jgi:dethiobiotin synthetase